MKFRPSRGNLVQSMKEVVDLPDRDALATHITQKYGMTPPIRGHHLRFKELGFDERNGWFTSIVLAPRLGVVGFIDTSLLQGEVH